MITQLLTPSHVAILVVVLLLLFGPRRLPQTGRALGRILHQFVDATAGEDAAPDVKRPHPHRTLPMVRPPQELSATQGRHHATLATLGAACVTSDFGKQPPPVSPVDDASEIESESRRLALREAWFGVGRPAAVGWHGSAQPGPCGGQPLVDAVSADDVSASTPYSSPSRQRSVPHPIAAC
jgi:sec-independent protein translocase protein TatA